MSAYDALYTSAAANILWAVAPGRLVARIHEFVPSVGRVLDAGCGDGKNALFLETHGFEVTGIDSSAAALTGLRNRFACASLPPSGRYLRADVHDWMQAEPYDVLVSYGLFHCLPRRTRSITHKRLTALVRPGGVILFSALTDDLPLPERHGTTGIELASAMELTELFSDVRILERTSGTFEEHHRPTIGLHRHSAVWIVAQA